MPSLLRLNGKPPFASNTLLRITTPAKPIMDHLLRLLRRRSVCVMRIFLLFRCERSESPLCYACCEKFFNDYCGVIPRDRIAALERHAMMYNIHRYEAHAALPRRGDRQDPFHGEPPARKNGIRTGSRVCPREIRPQESGR